MPGSDDPDDRGGGGGREGKGMSAQEKVELKAQLASQADSIAHSACVLSVFVRNANVEASRK